ncbi:dinitrogenase iron-molybdenum cofactor biosynthesis protein [Pseudodesulfovibrio sp. JC047]|uniref:NifB/NifX family molybdenum-iron cluster-binding protein n=1 Tax=Pseudodesulfovibrio sp. JC047 TaxID=2683199 RepID=UPI0013D8A6BC|nr:dinitrogenase iron-molybdenum cofactor biosynthesis protein [Pseudodesulfovibrio sp. JC047]NDV19625.1 dinitrogenase iron-molybdenum cofactor biosynthesis protein [Pseudodesulfovibrio sp. JC047]
MEKILIPLIGNELAPRFDMALEVLIVSVTRETSAMGKIDEKIVILDAPSSETMYRMVMSESVKTILCAGIEKEIYDFLRRKRLRVIDNVCGPVDPVLEAYLMGTLTEGQSYY